MRHRISLRPALVGAALALLLPAECALAVSSSDTEQAALPDFPPTRFVIGTGNGTTIGHSQYAISREPGGATLRGENRYLDGQSDVEVAHFRTTGSGAPALTDYRHTFYKPDGSPMLDGLADFQTGSCSCTDYRVTPPRVRSTELTFPPETWAGASVLIPTQRWLKSVGREPALHLQVFNCAPGPEIFDVRVTIDRPLKLTTAKSPAGATRVAIRPVLGWWDVVIAPFIPRLYAWYDPAHNYDLVRVQLTRFYRGPVVVLTPEAGAVP